MNSKATTHAPRHASASRRAAATDQPPQLQELVAACMGLPWLDMWMRAWSAWFDMPAASGFAPLGERSDAADRRQAGMPWLPQFESQVIPFRRRDDDPRLAATKVSMRMRVPAFPWILGTSNVIAIDTLMPRAVEDVADPGVAVEAKAEAREAEQMRQGKGGG